MQEPIISYSAKLIDDKEYKDTREFYAGTASVSAPLKLKVRIWNNRFGTEEVEALKDFAINFYFGNEEDKSFIRYLNVKYDTNTDMNIEIVDDIAIATFWEEKVLSGKPNNGKESDKENFIDLMVELDFASCERPLKNLDLKSLYMEIIKQ